MHSHKIEGTARVAGASRVPRRRVGTVPRRQLVACQYLTRTVGNVPRATTTPRSRTHPAPAPRSRHLFAFPNPVNEAAARTVAAGVVLLGAMALVTGWHWVLLPLALGFWARLLTGPTLSPLGQLATRVIAPRLPGPVRYVPGPPKRFAQGIGAAFSTAAVVLWYGAGWATASWVALGLLVAAATLEAVFGLCLGCAAFGLLMRAGVIPAAVCASCADLSRRVPAPDAPPRGTH